jgi:DNA (cytosine-5)-methyltransferase 1
MKYLSVCSGMEAATVAWHHMGWTPVGFSEIEPFPSAILKHRFPNVPNYGDLTKHAEWPIEQGAVDLLVGGTPCQSYSIAGKREGLDDPRGKLALAFAGLAERIRPKWILWENVPGVLSSGGGFDFAAFQDSLVKVGYQLAWRVLDARYFGTPQRRKRVFLVGYLGNWRPAAAVLFESDCLRGDSEEGGASKKEHTARAKDGVEGRCGERIFGSYSDANTAFSLETTSHDWSRSDQLTMIMKPVAFQPGNIRRQGGSNPSEDSFPTLSTDSGDQNPHIAIPPRTIRRLTPVECERLQGFPDNWSRIPWKGKPEDQCPDGPRYKACGNSMAVPVMAFIGKRIAEVEAKGHQS